MKMSIVACVVAVAGCTTGWAETADDQSNVTRPLRSRISSDMPVSDMGMASKFAASSVPPLGIGVDPSSGTAGDGSGTGRISVMSGWSGGPGAVAVYGEQLVIPLQVLPGSTLANASCDVWNPNTAAGVSVLYELWSSTGRVVASNTIPASTSVIFRSWLLPPPNTITADGGQYTMKLTPRNADGSWTTSSSPIQVISCAANAVHTLPLAAAAFVVEDPNHPLTYSFGTLSGPSFAARANVAVPVGHQIVAVRALVQDSATDQNAKMDLQLISINSNGTNVIASSPVSTGNGAIQTIAIAPDTMVQSGMAYQLHVYALGQPSAPVQLWFAEVDFN